MKTADIDYFVKSARALLHNRLLFGQPINTNNDEEVIATLYTMYLDLSCRIKELEVNLE